ncbi:MAG TPA: hypothetical protein PLL75_00555 [Candidatus Omnitrophota bacterium]|nr:hypothetical protein [Candidatus Omnitrophota bacterium]HPS36205.1 hypothetical protein [Candidatus Omnitrophota bacterium]
MQEDLRRLFWMLGLALTLPMVLLSGPLAGYLISRWLIQQWHFDTGLTLILTLLGLAGSTLQTVRILKQLYRAEKKNL